MIDGAHQGVINSEATVIIGKTGSVEGELIANTLSITGQFQGTADCENVEIHAGGALKGKVISNNLTIDQSCTFEGESVKKSSQGRAVTQKINRSKDAAPELPAKISAS